MKDWRKDGLENRGLEEGRAWGDGIAGGQTEWTGVALKVWHGMAWRGV